MECETCLELYDVRKTFSTKNNLNKHRRKFHEAEIPVHYMCECQELECSLTFNRRERLIEHLRDDHERKMYSVLTQKFETFDQFRAWQETTEAETFTVFRKIGSAQPVSDGGTAEHLVCHRNSRTPASTSHLSDEENRASLHCTAFIKVVTGSTEVTARFCLVHYGHNPKDEFYSLSLSSLQRDLVAQKLADGVPKRRIMLDIREEAWLANEQDGSRSRLMYLTMQDIQNVERDCHLRGVYADNDEHASIQTEYDLQSVGPASDKFIVYLKNIGQKCKYAPQMPLDHFVAVIQTQFQRDMMKYVDPRTLCIDSTHGTLLDVDMKLVTLLGLDESERGIPLAHFIVNHDTTNAVAVGFHALQEQFMTKEVNYLLSDDAEHFHIAWKTVFRDKSTRRILCVWHVGKAVNLRVDRGVKDTAVATSIKKGFRAVMYATSSEELKDAEEALLNSCAPYPALVDYFQKNYLKRVPEWALMHRPGASMTTSGYSEAFHRVFKRVHLAGRPATRVDELATLLVSYSRHLKIERAIQQSRPEESYRQRELGRQHRAAVQNKKMFFLQQDEECRWACTRGPTKHSPEEAEDKTDSGDCHIVRLVSCTRLGCKLVCKGCRPFCVHMLICDCPSALGMKKYCKHSHLVGDHLRENATTYGIGDAATNVDEVEQGNEPDRNIFVDEASTRADGALGLDASRRKDSVKATAALTAKFAKHKREIFAVVDDLDREKTGVNVKKLTKLAHFAASLRTRGRLFLRSPAEFFKKVRPGNCKMRRQHRRFTRKRRPARSRK